MTLERPRGHGEVLAGLWGAAKADRLPHALLFTGGEGVGKFMAAQWFFAGIFCEEGPGEPCGQCGACKRVRAGSFGDLFIIDAEQEGKAQISVGRIARRKHARRERVSSRPDEDAEIAETSQPDKEGACLEEFFSLRPSEGGWRGAILRDFERANSQAQNALLKTLEEPGDDCCLVLVSANPGQLLETVRSRCVEVGLRSPEGSVCAEILAEAGIGPEDARLISRWAAGAPGRAFRLARRGGASEREVLVGVLGGEIDALVGTERVLAIEGELGEGTPGVLARRRAVGVVELAVEILRDLARSRAGVSASKLPHGDVLEAFSSRARESGVTRHGLETLWRARRELDSNLAPEAVLDRAFSELQDAFSGARSPSRGR